MEFLTGKENWRVTDRGLMIGSLIAAGERMIILGQKGELVFANINSKKFDEINRDQVIGGRCWTMPILANGLLYLRNAKGDLACIDLR